MSDPSPRRAPVLSARGLTTSYPPAPPVLRGVDLELLPGEMLSIVGPSGSGKSTLLYCLAGLERADAGEILLDDVRVDRASHARLARLRRDRIGFVFQSYNLIPSLTVRENVSLPARLAGRRPDPDAALRAVGLADHGRKRPGHLSGGQQQRVAIARVLAASPAVVFADEPTGALDTQTGAGVLDLLRGYAAGEKSVVLVTHDLDAAARADRTLVLRDGRVVARLVRPTAGELLAALHGASDRDGARA
ncbi:ABC transporter ATP-binding protein [Microbacterium tumbae]